MYRQHEHSESKERNGIEAGEDNEGSRRICGSLGCVFVCVCK